MKEYGISGSYAQPGSGALPPIALAENRPGTAESAAMNEVVVAAITYLGVRGTTFLDELVKPFAEEAGKDLLHKYKNWRGSNLGAVVEQAAELSGGAAIHPVPGRILFPLLESASNEEDPELREKWASLLANASTRGTSIKILPAYVEILRQLVPKQAQILDWMYRQKLNVRTPYETWDIARRSDIESRFDLSPMDYALLISDLNRLQLVDGTKEAIDLEKPTFEQMALLAAERWNDKAKYELLTFTALGLRFIEACQPPTKS